jgi:hypothetical protein
MGQGLFNHAWGVHLGCLSTGDQEGTAGQSHQCAAQAAQNYHQEDGQDHRKGGGLLFHRKIINLSAFRILI